MLFILNSMKENVSIYVVLIMELMPIIIYGNSEQAAD